LKKDKRLDARLVKAYQSGNQEALAALVKRWHLIFSIINKIETLHDASNFGSWALRIVYNKSLDVLREKSKQQKRQQTLDKKQVEITDINEEKETINKQLLKAIKKLPQQQQIVIRLFYLEEYSIKKISKILNISKGTAKSRLFYAREKLRLTLKNKIYEK